MLSGLQLNGIDVTRLADLLDVRVPLAIKALSRINDPKYGRS